MDDKKWMFLYMKSLIWIYRPRHGKIVFFLYYGICPYTHFRQYTVDNSLLQFNTQTKYYLPSLFHSRNDQFKVFETTLYVETSSFSYDLHL